MGEENPDAKDSRFKPVETSAESAHTENRRGPEDNPNEVEERERLRGAQDEEQQREQEKQRRREEAEEQRQQQDLEDIQQLAARDREVRAHEAAHAAVGGQYAGAPQYQFTRGPDGLSYAVAGEVSIDTSKIAGDPEATLEKARQVRAAANAPAEPSSQDRRVAAAAAQMEAEALAEIAETRRQQQVEERQQLEEEEALAREEREQRQQAQDAEASERSQAAQKDFSEVRQRQLDLNRRLIDIGVRPPEVDVGSLLDQRA